MSVFGNLFTCLRAFAWPSCDCVQARTVCPALSYVSLSMVRGDMTFQRSILLPVFKEAWVSNGDSLCFTLLIGKQANICLYYIRLAAR